MFQVFRNKRDLLHIYACIHSYTSLHYTLMCVYHCSCLLFLERLLLQGVCSCQRDKRKTVLIPDLIYVLNVVHDSFEGFSSFTLRILFPGSFDFLFFLMVVSLVLYTNNYLLQVQALQSREGFPTFALGKVSLVCTHT